MKTECTQKTFEFQGLGRRSVVAQSNGGDITSDAGALLLREQEHASGVIRRFAACFEDHRDPNRVEHSVLELVAQRVYALALGYEDLNDHDDLRVDPLLATLVEKVDPTGKDRRRKRDRGKPRRCALPTGRWARSCESPLRRRRGDPCSALLESGKAMSHERARKRNVFRGLHEELPKRKRGCHGVR